MLTLSYKHAMTIALTILIGISFASNNLLADNDGQILEVEVKGMFCPVCAYGAEKKVKEIEGVESVVADLKAGKVTVVTKRTHTHKITEAELKEAIRKAGFQPGNIEYIDGEESDGGQVLE